MKFEFSAGGVVFKKEDNSVKILVAQNSNNHSWVFPKGLIGDHQKGESKEETAVREVKEETGIEGKILKELSPIEYWYQWEGEKRKKKVYYYIMDFVSEDLGSKDDEMESVEWVDYNEVENKLSYPSDKKVWSEAKELIK